MNITMTPRTECDDYCSDCGRCHDFESRSINWGEIAPACLIGAITQDNFQIPCVEYGHLDD